MGVTVPNPEGVENDLITAVCDGYGGGAEVEIRATDNDRPGLLRVYEGTVHTHYGDYEVVGVTVSDDKTCVHVE